MREKPTLSEQVEEWGSEWPKFLCGFGLMAAGYLGFYEILMELTLVSIGLAQVIFSFSWFGEAGPTSTRQKFIRWALELKKERVERIIRRGGAGVVAGLILGAIAVGWMLSLGSLLFQPWQAVVAREIKETVLDVVIFVPFFYFVLEAVDHHALADNLIARYQAQAKGDTAEVNEEVRALREKAKQKAAKFEETRRDVRTTSLVILCLACYAMYGAGVVLGWICDIKLLDIVAAWRL